MSTHGPINRRTLSGLADPDKREGGIQFELNEPEFVWADTPDDAIAFLDRVMRYAEKGKAKLSKIKAKEEEK